MTYRVIIQPRAERDIRRTAFWILEQSKSTTTALRWARGIRAKIDTLKTNPLRCPVDDDSEAYGVEVRFLLFGRRKNHYKIIFLISDHTVNVLTVRHSAQNNDVER